MLDLWETQKPKEPLDKTAPLRVGMQVAYVPQHVIAKYGGSAAEAILKRWKADGFKSNSKGGNGHQPAEVTPDKFRKYVEKQGAQ